MKRKCKKCLEQTKAVCKYVFGVFWCIKSDGGAGCDHPLDAVAESWREAGWSPGGNFEAELMVHGGEAKIKCEELTDEDY